MLSRPSLEEVLAYRSHVDAELIGRCNDLPGAARELIELGLNHEQQHQELMLMDMLAAMSENPLKPAIWKARPEEAGLAEEATGRSAAGTALSRSAMAAARLPSTARGRGTGRCSTRISSPIGW
jgi:hypothetical protein